MSNNQLKEIIKDFISKNKEEFIPWKSQVPVSGKIFDETELQYMIESVMDCHWTEGRWNDMFEKWLADFLWSKFVITTNSGSSANLLALTALTAKELWERQLKQWDEVITVASWFPTTINPIIQNWLIPVFVDVELWTYEVDIEELKKAISPKTKAIMLAHTLWNAFNLDEITKICEENNLRLIEDNCDALWTMYNGKYTWTFGDIWTLSFYPAHHITMGEWWALITNNALLAKIIKSFRDWWRDCWCKTGEDNSCKNRFKWKLGNLPEWFDHKYIYSRIGYNLKVTDMQAALWVAQLEKLSWFIQKRKNNFNYLYSKFIENWLDQYFIMPKATLKSDPSRFWFLLSTKEWWINREKLMQFLNENKIWTRLLFAGNYLNQPAFIDYVKDYRVVWDLKNSNYVMNHTFWLWVYPWLTNEHLNYIVLKIKEFIDENK
jgi:CDP-6-deoxy-D-xylo-4-hexulose-3-dehydrase